MKDYRNYHKYDIKSKIKRDAEFIFNRTIRGYAGKDVYLNGYPSKILIYQKNDADGSSYKIAGYPMQIERGNLVYYQGDTYIITSKPEDNDIYKKAIMTFCNSELIAYTEPTREQIGVDDRKRPIYRDMPSEEFTLPCIAKMQGGVTANTNEPINLLETQILVTISFAEFPSIKINKKFSMFNNTYRIININYVDSSYGVGIMHILGERVESSGDV